MAEKEVEGDDGAQTPPAPDIESVPTGHSSDEGGDTESIVEYLDDDLLSDGHWHALPPSDLVTFQLAGEPSDGENFLFHGGGADFKALYLAPVSEYFSGMFEELGPMPPTELISAEALQIQQTHHLVQQTRPLATATITVTAVNDAVGAISDTNAAANSVAENAANGTAVGITASASDADGSDTVTYSLSNDAGGRFAIDANTGVVTVAEGTLLDYETATSHTIEVTATSSDDSTSTQSYTVNLTDVTEGTAGDDTIQGSNGVDDVIDGLAGNDNLDGRSGNDTLYGGSGNDTLDGGSGIDILIGGAGADVLDGGNGNDDTASYAGSGAGVSVNLATGSTSGGDAAGDTLSNIENLIGSDHDDILIGDSTGGGANTLDGGLGDDTLTGAGGNDVLIGGAGNDGLSGAAGNDTLDGGSGNDTLDGGAGQDTLVWDTADATIDGGTGGDTLRVDSGDADLTAFGGAISGIEIIDLESDTGANTVTLAAQDVLDMSDTDTVTITGDAGDSVEAGTGWTDGGISGGFHTYTQGLATLLVDTDVTVNGDITA